MNNEVFCRCLTTKDVNKSNKMNNIFLQILRQFSINLSEEDFYHLMSFYDHQMKGRVPYNDFIRAFLQWLWRHNVNTFIAACQSICSSKRKLGTFLRWLWRHNLPTWTVLFISPEYCVFFCQFIETKFFKYESSLLTDVDKSGFTRPWSPIPPVYI